VLKNFFLGYKIWLTQDGECTLTHTPMSRDWSMGIEIR
jgi:hypothetical protein